MLQFIVLGLIPGTHLQITYHWIMALLEIATGLVIVLLAYDYLWLRPQFLQYLEMQKAKSKTKKRKTATN